MSERKKSMLPSLEIIVIVIFFLGFIAWAFSKCTATKQQFASDDPEAVTDGEVDTDSIYFSMPKPLPPKEEPAITSADGVTTIPATGNQAVRTEIRSRLYITIDGLNMRTAPHLDSTVVEKLALFEEVAFMDEYTEFKQELSLGKEMAFEPWVKIKTKRGKIGWVYGAGVDYRRKEREGVQ
jgi:hypothetical protein